MQWKGTGSLLGPSSPHCPKHKLLHVLLLMHGACRHKLGGTWAARWKKGTGDQGSGSPNRPSNTLRDLGQAFPVISGPQWKLHNRWDGNQPLVHSVPHDAVWGPFEWASRCGCPGEGTQGADSARSATPWRRPHGSADTTPQRLDMNIVSETGDIKNDNALLLQQVNLMSPRDRILNSSAKNQ